MSDSVALLVKALRDSGRALIDTSICGNTPPAYRARYDRMQVPRPGDVVLEVSTFWAASDPKWRHRDQWFTAEETVGTLDRIAREPIPGEWDEEDGTPEEEVFYIRRFRDGELIRWTNARFISISWDGMHVPGGAR